MASSPCGSSWLIVARTPFLTPEIWVGLPARTSIQGVFFESNVCFRNSLLQLMAGRTLLLLSRGSMPSWWVALHDDFLATICLIHICMRWVHNMTHQQHACIRSEFLCNHFQIDSTVWQFATQRAAVTGRNPPSSGHHSAYR